MGRKTTPQEAEANFRAAVDAIGATVVGEYRRSTRPVEIRCQHGHTWAPRPNAVQQGKPVCYPCFQDGRRSSALCLLCPDRHYANGLCQKHNRRLARHGDPDKLLRKSDWDSFYVVSGDGVVKFGVTGDAATRLRVHAADGLDQVERLLTGLPDGAAKYLEDQVKAVLAEAGAVPVHGREYFGENWSEFILHTADRLV